MASELWLKAFSLLMAILVCELEGSIRPPCPTSPSRCFQPPVRGLCRAYFRRYYFDSKSGKCKMFIYGGCRGNRNNFRDKKSCDQTCPAICRGGGTNIKPTPSPKICAAILRGPCTFPPVKGPCRARKARFYYDQRTNQCKMFIYGGCRGNGNNFKTMKRCRKNCPDKCFRRKWPKEGVDRVDQVEETKIEYVIGGGEEIIPP